MLGMSFFMCSKNRVFSPNGVYNVSKMCLPEVSRHLLLSTVYFTRSSLPYSNCMKHDTGRTK